MNLEKKSDESTVEVESSLARSIQKKAYRAPGLSIYGRIERATGGGSGMSKESFAMETFRKP